MDNQNYAAQFYSDISGEIDLLEKNIEEYPASSVARFMWLYHLKKNDDPRFKEVAKQTGIYLNNPLWIEYQLSKSDVDDDIVNEGFPQNLISGNEPTEIKNEEISNEPFEEIQNENPVDLTEQKSDEENLSLIVNEEIPQNSISENEPTEIKNEEINNEPFGENQNEKISNEPFEEIQNENPVDFNEQKIEEENLPSTVNEEIPQNSISENEPTEIKNEEINNEPFGENQNEEINNEPFEEIQNENPVDLTEQKSVEPNESIDKEISVPFEPLHTVDYFASQGIKLSEEALANDQLGRQVKSFTAWLKTMKRLHPGQLPEQNEVIEKIIQSSSEVSNRNANVLTEAMAEVLVKQGKREKAVEMYEKLSLMNPSKSAYFAAKIESLKTV